MFVGAAYMPPEAGWQPALPVRAMHGIAPTTPKNELRPMFHNLRSSNNY